MSLPPRPTPAGFATRAGRARPAAIAAVTALAALALFGAAGTRHGAPLAAAPVMSDTTPTFTRDVAPILYRNCASCHRPGGIGPFSVLDYDSVKTQLKDIGQAVRTGQMPP